MLVISDFSKNYGDELILSVKSLSLDAGIHLIKGDNGSGKTSLFKSVAGIVPSSGEISIDKVSLREHPVAYRYAVNSSVSTGSMTNPAEHILRVC